MLSGNANGNDTIVGGWDGSGWVFGRELLCCVLSGVWIRVLSMWCARCILITGAFQMSGEVSLFSRGTWHAEEQGKRHGIVGRVEKLSRRRNPEVIRVPSHHN